MFSQRGRKSRRAAVIDTRAATRVSSSPRVSSFFPRPPAGFQKRDRWHRRLEGVRRGTRSSCDAGYPQVRTHRRHDRDSPHGAQDQSSRASTFRRGTTFPTLRATPAAPLLGPVYSERESLCARRAPTPHWMRFFLSIFAGSDRPRRRASKSTGRPPCYRRS